ncbi:MAG: DUF354 domain-containing protein [Chloroflexota bacterium]|nr:DUF354 domain-containing protein [Chloroflexota bacterium]
MKILIDLTHPAHVHFFKYAARIWTEHGHDVKFVARDKEVTLQLMDAYGFSYRKLSSIRSGLVGLSVEMIEHQSRLYAVIKEFKPDVILNIGGTFIVHVAKLLGIKTCVFTDTDDAKLSNMITFPFATWICTPDCYPDDLGKKQVRYQGYQELAYLHPNYFKPDPEVLKLIGLEADERFFILRFVSWGATHDVGQRGLSEDSRRTLINRISKFGKVLITSEADLPEELSRYQINIPPEFMHDLLYYASLYIGEGATMASEAAILGTPSIFSCTRRLSYLEELEHKYHLTYRIEDNEQAVEKAIEIASGTEEKSDYVQNHKQMLEEKIDVTNWVVEFVENVA